MSRRHRDRSVELGRAIKHARAVLLAFAAGLALALATDAWLSPPDVPALLRQLRDPNPDERARAAYALSQRDSLTDSVCSALANTLDDHRIREEMIAILIDAGGRWHCIEHVAAVVEDDRNSLTRVAGIRVLGGIGQPASRVGSAVLLRVMEARASDRAHAAMALGALGDTTPEVLAALVHLFHNGSEVERSNAIDALTRLGNVRVLAPLAEEAVVDRSAEMRVRGIEALELAIAARVLPIQRLLPFLKDGDAEVRRTAVESLSRLRSRWGGMVAELVPLLSDSDSTVRRAAERALRSSGGLR